MSGDWRVVRILAMCMIEYYGVYITADEYTMVCCREGLRLVSSFRDTK